MESRISEMISKHSVSPQAADWINKAFYPPGHITKVAIPDASWRPGLRTDARPSTVVGAPSGLNTPTWDCMVVHPPGDNTVAIFVAGSAGTDFASNSAPTAPDVMAMSVVQIAKPESFETLNHPSVELGLTDAGAVEVDDTTQYSTRSAYDAQAFRTTYRSSTVILTASDLYNGGTLTVGQMDAEYRDTDILVSIANVASGGAFCAQSLSVIPLRESSMTQTMPGVATVPAKDGYFIPHRLMGPSQAFVRATPAYGKRYLANPSSGEFDQIVLTDAAPGSTSTQSSITRIVQYTNGELQIPYWSQQFTDVNNIPGMANLYDIGYDTCATGVAIFRGLDPHATLTYQGHVGIEYILRETSPFRDFVQDSAPYDSKAMHLYYDVVTTMPMVYPASDNDHGGLLPKLWSALKTAARVSAPILLPAAKAALRAAIADAPMALATRCKASNPNTTASLAQTVTAAARKEERRLRRLERKERPAAREPPKTVQNSKQRNSASAVKRATKR